MKKNKTILAILIAFAALLVMPGAFAAPTDWDNCTTAMSSCSTQQDGCTANYASFPFSWTYYGETITSGNTVKVRTDGYITVDGSIYETYPGSEAALKSHKLIAPLWLDLVTQLYACNYADHVTFRWNGKEYGTTNLEDFEVKIYNDSTIYFVYNVRTATSPSRPIFTGISKGDSINPNYQIFQQGTSTAPPPSYGPITTTVTCPNGTCSAGENCPADIIACPDQVCKMPTCIAGCGLTSITNTTDPGQCDALNMGGGCATLPCQCNSSGNCASVNYITKSGNLTTSETWSGTVYISSDLHVTGYTTTLTINPDTVIKFATGNVRIFIESAAQIYIQGTLGHNITFTSCKDQTVGANLSAICGSSPAAGDYTEALYLDTTGTNNSTDLTYLTIKYANHGIGISPTTTIGSILNSNIVNSLTSGIFLNGGNIGGIIADNTISNVKRAIYVYNANAAINGVMRNTITTNSSSDYAIYKAYDDATILEIRDNTISLGNSTAEPIDNCSINTEYYNNTVTKLGFTYPKQYCGKMRTNQTFTTGNTYYISGLTVTGPITLTIQPGAIIKYASGKNITLQGGAGINIQTAAGQTTYFTSCKDQTIGQNINSITGCSGAPAAGNYSNALYFDTTGTNNSTELKQLNIKYAANALYINSGTIGSIANSSITNCTRGIYNNSGTIGTVNGNNINCPSGTGLYTETSSAIVSEIKNNVFANSSNGIYVNYGALSNIRGNIFRQNTDGIELIGSTITPGPIANNLFEQNTNGLRIGGDITNEITNNNFVSNAKGIYTTAGTISSILNNVFANNTTNGIHRQAGTITSANYNAYFGNAADLLGIAKGAEDIDSSKGLTVSPFIGAGAKPYLLSTSVNGGKLLVDAGSDLSTVFGMDDITTDSTTECKDAGIVDIGYHYATTNSSSCITNEPPTATITSPADSTTIPVDQSITFTGIATDTDGTITEYKWECSPSAGASCPTSFPIASQNPGAIQFDSPGEYAISFDAKDDYDQWSTSPATRTITVTSGGNQAPNATLLPTDQSGQAPLAVNFTATCFDPEGEIYSCVLRFGDGTADYPFPVSAGTGGGTTSHSFPAGTWRPKLVATDAASLRGEATSTITANKPEGAVVLSVVSFNLEPNSAKAGTTNAISASAIVKNNSNNTANATVSLIVKDEKGNDFTSAINLAESNPQVQTINSKQNATFSFSFNAASLPENKYVVSVIVSKDLVQQGGENRMLVVEKSGTTTVPVPETSVLFVPILAFLVCLVVLLSRGKRTG